MTAATPHRTDGAIEPRGGWRRALTLDAIALRLLGARVLHLMRVVDALRR